MKPGRELDALVAEKVMGLAPLAKPAEVRSILNNRLDLPPPERLELARRLTEEEHPPFSTDIAAAWKVVEKFFWVEINCDNLNEEIVVTIGAIFSKDTLTHRTANEGRAATVAHAICLAALKAAEHKGVE